MAYAYDTPRGSALIERLFAAGANLLDGAADALARRRIYRETLRDLEGLSRRELDDIGIGPGQIRSVAWATANGKPVR